MFKDFKEFAMRGNVVDMAVGVIIGGAFGKIVSSFVSDIIMPVLGALVGNVDFSNNFIVLSGSQQSFATLKEAQDAGAATFNYGLFISNILNFLLIALALFFFVRMLNRLKAQEPEAVPVTKKCQYCFMEIPIDATKCPYCTADLPK